MSKTETKKWMLFFPRCECEQPIVYHLVKDHNLVVNVYRAKVTPNEEGYLVLDVTGTEEDIASGMEFVKTFRVTINETGIGVMRDEKRCTHCGICVPHCPTGALSIKDNKTRRVEFNGEACIECLECILVCPYAACASAF
ncbi:MAG: 4Fe-4S binding protein [Pirellulales bacterium]|nr:4Fe-4S binding protein [Pirellulales bacterium]